MELRKLLMSSGHREGTLGQPGSPKVEGAGKKVVAGLQQVSGHAATLQTLMVGSSPGPGSSTGRRCWRLAGPMATPLGLPLLSLYSASCSLEQPQLLPSHGSVTFAQSRWCCGLCVGAFSPRLLVFPCQCKRSALGPEWECE